MIVLLLLFISLASAVDMPSSLHEGKALAETANAQNAQGIANEGQDFQSFHSLKIHVTDNPKESRFSTYRLKHEADRAKDDETYQIIADNQEHRNYGGFTEKGLEESFLETKDHVLGGPGEETKEGYTLVECQTPGDIYELSCTQTLQVNVTIIPELNHDEYSCPGHKKKSWLSGTRWCRPGCQKRTIIDRLRQVIQSDTWTEGCEDIEKLHDQGLCNLIKEVPDPLNQTKTINGEPITREHWQTTRIYRCGFADDSPNSCNRMNLEGCTEISKRCEVVHSSGVCAVYTHTYRCPADKIQLPNLAPGPHGFCLTGDCLPTQQQSNRNIFNALSRLEILRHMQGQISDINAISIFKGEIQACTINFGGGFKDCCRGMRGFGLKLKLAKSCSADERALADARAQGRSVALGSYVKNRHLGITFSKAQVFCTFPTKIARIFQQEARKQLRIGWGGPQNPDCRGLSLAELQSLDFEKMDLSELYTELTQRIKKSSEILRSVMADKTRDLSAQSKRTVERTHRGRIEDDRVTNLRGGNVKTY